VNNLTPEGRERLRQSCIARTRPLADRLRDLSIPEPNSGCILWLGCTNKLGYGRIGVHGSQKQAHRVSFLASGKTIPPGMMLDHLCRTPGCINPDHLEPVTNAENGRRGKKGILKTHCARGHPWTADYIEQRGKWRRCKVCARESVRRWRRAA
jgi:hypothetical protein